MQVLTGLSVRAVQNGWQGFMIVFFSLEELVLQLRFSSFLKKCHPCPIGQSASDSGVHSDFELEAKRTKSRVFVVKAQLTPLTVLLS
jgi:hypothetical protein